LAGSDEKNEDGVTVFSSTSMPAFAPACLMTACIFWAAALVALWKTTLSRLPSRARTPSAPRFLPRLHHVRTPANEAVGEHGRIGGWGGGAVLADPCLLRAAHAGEQDLVTRSCGRAAQ
jgi:hypothetical protein